MFVVGVGPERVGAEKVGGVGSWMDGGPGGLGGIGAWRDGGPKFRAFVHSSTPISFSFVSLWVSSRGILVGV